MNPQVDSLFPIIPPPMALAVNTIAGSSKSSKDKKIVLEPPHWLYHEDVFLHLSSSPLILPHYAIYCMVPVVYLLHFSPFSNFEPGTVNQTIRWTLQFLTQLLTAVLAVACLARHYRVRKELIGFTTMALVVTLFAGFKHGVGEMAADKG